MPQWGKLTFKEDEDQVNIMIVMIWQSKNKMQWQQNWIFLPYQWLGVRLLYLLYISNGDTAAIHWMIDIIHLALCKLSRPTMWYPVDVIQQCPAAWLQRPRQHITDHTHRQLSTTVHYH